MRKAPFYSNHSNNVPRKWSQLNNLFALVVCSQSKPQLDRWCWYAIDNIWNKILRCLSQAIKQTRIFLGKNLWQNRLKGNQEKLKGNILFSWPVREVCYGELFRFNYDIYCPSNGLSFWRIGKGFVNLTSSYYHLFSILVFYTFVLSGFTLQDWSEGFVRQFHFRFFSSA